VLEGAPPSYQQRQTIVALLPDIIANLDIVLVQPTNTTIEEQPPVVEPTLPPSEPEALQVLTEPALQIALPLLPQPVSVDTRISTPIVTPYWYDYPPSIVRPTDNIAPLPVATSDGPRRLRVAPPWELSRPQSREWWRYPAAIRCGVSSLITAMDQLLGILAQVLIWGRRLLWGGLCRLWNGIWTLVRLNDELRIAVDWQPWLLLGMVVVVVAIVLGGFRLVLSGTGLMSSVPVMVTPAQVASTPVLALRRARIVGTGSLGLIARAEPDGRRVGKLKDGAEVVVLAGPSTVSNQAHPTWWQVQHGDLVGWVSARFLTFLDTP
jgi:hypothetical protein